MPPTSPPTARVASFTLETSADRVVASVWLSAEHGPPVDSSTEIRVILARHDDVAVQWWTDMSCSWESDHWVGELQAPRELTPRLAQLTDVVIGPDRQKVLLPPNTIYLETAEDGQWEIGEPAEAERRRLTAVRDATFSQPLKSSGVTEASPKFAVVMAVDNLLSSTAQRIPGMQILPVQDSTLGSDLLDFLNGCAAQLGFSSGVSPAAGLALIRQRRPAVVLYAPKVIAETHQAAMAEARRAALTLLDLIALRRGATPRLLAGVVGDEASPGSLKVINFWVEGSGYSGNLVGGPLSGEEPTSLLNQWRGVEADGRTRLWLSLYSDALADERWDYRVFRCFNLLEGIAAEIVSPHQPVSDVAGNPLLQSDGKPYTTDQARGKVFQLVNHVAQQGRISMASFAASSSGSRTAWDETNVWVTIRNAVAHRGSWEQAPGVVMSARDQRVQAEVSSLGHDGTFPSGILVELQVIKRTVELVLLAALNGRL